MQEVGIRARIAASIGIIGPCVWGNMFVGIVALRLGIPLGISPLMCNVLSDNEMITGRIVRYPCYASQL